MYRILEQNQEVRERRDQLHHPNYAKPELVATAPNQLWSWDITKLLGPTKWTYYYLYVIIDVFSRYVPGWLLADCESDESRRNQVKALWMSWLLAAAGACWPARPHRDQPAAANLFRRRRRVAGIC
jgi:transposase InsO family protein